MGREGWELAYIITQHLKPECRGLQTQCALTALPLNAKQTYIKQHKESNLCRVLFRLGVFLAISLRRRTFIVELKEIRHQNAPNIRGRTSTGPLRARIGWEIRNVWLSRLAVAPACVLHEGQNLSAKCCTGKITGVLRLRVSLWWSFSFALSPAERFWTFQEDRSPFLCCFLSLKQSKSVLRHEKVPFVLWSILFFYCVVVLFPDVVFFSSAPPPFLCGLFGIMTKSHFESLTCSLLIGVVLTVSPSQFYSTGPHQ